MSDESTVHVAALIELKRWTEALSAVDRYLATNPGDAHGWCQRARVLLGLGRTSESLAAAGKAAGIAPEWEYPHRLRAVALLTLKNSKAALDAATRAAALAPDTPITISVLAQCQLAARKKTEAEASARRVIALVPDSPEGWEVLGTVLLRRRDKQGAIDAYGEALRLDPTSTAAMNGLGAALLASKRRDEAAVQFAQAARTDPHDKASRSNLELVTQVGGGFVFFLVFRAVVQSTTGAARIALAILLVLTGLAVLLAVREARTSRLPPDAERYVRAQRAERRRRMANPRNWWPVIAANPLRSLFLAGFAALVVVFVAFAPERDVERDDEPDIEIPPLEALCDSPLFSDPAQRPSACPPD